MPQVSARRSLAHAAAHAVAALLVGLLLAILLLPSESTVRGSGLAPVAAATPRDTFEGFRKAVGEGSALLVETYRHYRAEPGLTWSDEALAAAKRAETLIARAGRYLDLREVAPINLESRRLEATLLLKEVLDRLPAPESRTIPGPDSIPEGGGPARWNLPGTEIQIARVAEGPRAGEYLFSPETVRRLDEFYEALEERPDTAGAAPDLYTFYSQSPGRLLPAKWFSFIEALPDPFRIVLWQQALWQWLALGLVLAVAVLALAGVRLFLRRIRRSGGSDVALPASLIGPAAVAVAALAVLQAADTQINITGTALAAIEVAAEAVAYCAMMWGVVSFTRALASSAAPPRALGGRGLDAHLARAAVRSAGLAAALALLVNGASLLGIPLSGIIAGLGVGGLALALAAKPTLENFICGLILYVDRPVRVGDYCRFDKFEGRIEEIGFRSTRIRAHDRTLINIPNATFVNLSLVNLSNRDHMPYAREIKLRRTADTTAIRREMEAYQEVVRAHPKIDPESVEIRLKDVHDEKPKADIRALIATSDWREALQVRHEIDLLLRDAPSEPTGMPSEPARSGAMQPA